MPTQGRDTLPVVPSPLSPEQGWHLGDTGTVQSPACSSRSPAELGFAVCCSMKAPKIREQAPPAARAPHSLPTIQPVLVPSVCPVCAQCPLASLALSLLPVCTLRC